MRCFHMSKQAYSMNIAGLDRDLPLFDNEGNPID